LEWIFSWTTLPQCRTHVRKADLKRRGRRKVVGFGSSRWLDGWSDTMVCGIEVTCQRGITLDRLL
jgi:hypothetical protein